MVLRAGSWESRPSPAPPIKTPDPITIGTGGLATTAFDHTLNTQPETRFGRFVLAGLPNSGKSTLLNRLAGGDIAIVSPKPQTTRLPVTGIVTLEHTQLLFVDPPGLLEPQHALDEALLEKALDEIRNANGIIYLVPATAKNPIPFSELPGIEESSKPLLTVTSKADLARGKREGELPETLRVSATTGEGIDQLLAWCSQHTRPGPFPYPPDDLSTMPLRFFVSEFVREAAFAVLEDELPYAIAAEVNEFRERSNPVYIRVTIYVERNSQKGIVIGEGGAVIRSIGTLARRKIETLLGSQVFLDLWVKVLPRWRTRYPALARFGLEPARKRGK